jgi:hypothetical protein
MNGPAILIITILAFHGGPSDNPPHPRPSPSRPPSFRRGRSVTTLRSTTNLTLRVTVDRCQASP